MPAEVKIVRFQLTKRDFTNAAEREIAELLDQGYTMASTGGAGVHAFVIMVKGAAPQKPQRPPAQRPPGQQRPT